MKRLRKIERRVLRWFEIIERPAAWVQMIAGLATFISVLVGWLIVDKGFKVGTLLIAASFFTSGFTSVQNAEDDDDDEPPAPPEGQS